MSIIQHSYNSHVISQREGDGYVSLTEMAKAGGKRVNNYLVNAGTLDYLEALSVDTGIPAMYQGDTKRAPKSGFLVIPSYQGTWAHREVAIDFASWVSPKFRVWANRTLSQVIDGTFQYYSNLDRQLDAQAELDRLRVESRQGTKEAHNDTGEAIKAYLLEIERYQDKAFTGRLFAQFNDDLNMRVIGETSRQFKDRTGLDVKLIRDYFPFKVLQVYLQALASTQLGMERGLDPVSALDSAFSAVGHLRRWNPYLLSGQELEDIKRASNRLSEHQSGQKRLMGWM